MIINVGTQINCSNKNFDPKNVIKKRWMKKISKLYLSKKISHKKCDTMNVGSKISCPKKIECKKCWFKIKIDI